VKETRGPLVGNHLVRLKSDRSPGVLGGRNIKGAVGMGEGGRLGFVKRRCRCKKCAWRTNRRAVLTKWRGGDNHPIDQGDAAGKVGRPIDARG